MPKSFCPLNASEVFIKQKVITRDTMSFGNVWRASCGMRNLESDKVIPVKPKIIADEPIAENNTRCNVKDANTMIAPTIVRTIP